MRKMFLVTFVILFLTSCKQENVGQSVKEYNVPEEVGIEKSISEADLKLLVKNEYDSMNEDLGGFNRPPNVSKVALEELLIKAKNSIFEKQIKKSIDSLETIMAKNMQSNQVIERNSYISSNYACEMAKDFIKKDLRYPSSADFSSFDCTSEQNTDGSYTILRKVSAKNGYGVESEYIYKVKLGLKSGHELELSNWDLISIRSEEYR